MSETGLPAPSFSSVPPSSPRGPMTFGQILDRVLQLMRTNWRLFVRIALAPGAGLIVYFGIIFAALFPVLKLVMLHQTVGFSPTKIASLAAPLCVA